MRKFPFKIVKNSLHTMLLFTYALLACVSSFAQVGINTTSPNAILDIQSSNETTPSNNDGILIPRVDNFATVNPTANQNGMLVFATGNGAPTKGFYYWDHANTTWVIITGTGGGGTGNTLDQAYDQNGAGLGKNIEATDGAVRINGEDGFLVVGSFGNGTTIDTEITGSGTRMFFNPNKAAFRAGNVLGTQWNDANIGDHSTAFGINTIASGIVSTAFGSNTEASGLVSTAFGGSTLASGISSTAFGAITIASGDYATAFGSSAAASGTFSTAFGFETEASGDSSTAFGNRSVASGNLSVAFGHENTAIGLRATAFGYNSTASGDHATAFGNGSEASGNTATAFGANTTASGNSAMAFGSSTTASGQNATAFGGSGTASGSQATVFGFASNAIASNATAFGYATNASADSATAFGDFSAASGLASTAFGLSTLASGTEATAFGFGTVASGDEATAFGFSTTASGFASVSFGNQTTASGFNSIASGYQTTAIGLTAVAFGHQTTASGGQFPTAFGYQTIASGFQTATAFGFQTTASADNSTAFGDGTEASGSHSTAFGLDTVASGVTATAFGDNTEASGGNATAFGFNTLASGGNGTAFGQNTTATAINATAFGTGTTAPSYSETVIGSYNTSYTPISATVFNSPDRLFTIGNGTNNAARGNALTIYKSGLMNINDAYDMPLTDGTANQVMTTNGAGVVSFQDANTLNGNTLDEAYDEGGFGAGRIINATNGPIEIHNNGGLLVESANQTHMFFVDGVTDAVGINTAAPTATLSVNGTANKPGGGTWAVFSDARLKKNVSNYNEGLALITKVRPVNFSYNDKMKTLLGENKSIEKRVYQGVIAQELQKIAPDMVKEVTITSVNNKDDSKFTGKSIASGSFLEVDPNKFTYALINAVQEQQEIIKELITEIEQMESRFDVQQKEIEAIKNHLKI